MMENVLQNLCRLCGEVSSKLRHIFEEDGTSQYCDKIKCYLHLGLTENFEIQQWLKICDNCGEKLTHWEEYAAHVLAVNEFFQSVPVISFEGNSGIELTKQCSNKIDGKIGLNRPLITADNQDLPVLLATHSGDEDVAEDEYPNDSQEDNEVSNASAKPKESCDDELSGKSSDKENTKLESERNAKQVEDKIEPNEDEPQKRRKTGVRSSIDLDLSTWDCSKCGESQNSFNSLVRHCKKEHDAVASVECLCGKTLHSRATVVKHRLKHTGRLQYKCTFENCTKTFHRQSLLDNHKASHLPKDKQPWLCCKCCRRFHSETLLKQHERLHLPIEAKLTYQCNTCQKRLCSKSALTAHVKAVHLRERPFVCHQCGNKFTSKGILDEHLKIHSDVCNYHCSDCNKSFKTKYRLKMHLETHGQTRFTCHVCSQSLNTRRTLRMHLLVHEDRRGFRCETCGKGFKRSKDLKNHRNLHTGKKPYSCPFCSRTFANGSNCRSHKRRMHPADLELYEARLAAGEKPLLPSTMVQTDHKRLLFVSNGPTCVSNTINVEEDTTHEPIMQKDDPMLNGPNLDQDANDDVVVKNESMGDIVIEADDLSSSLTMQYSSYAFNAGLSTLAGAPAFPTNPIFLGQ